MRFHASTARFRYPSFTRFHLQTLNIWSLSGRGLRHLASSSRLPTAPGVPLKHTNGTSTLHLLLLSLLNFLLPLSPLLFLPLLHLPRFLRTHRPIRTPVFPLPPHQHLLPIHLRNSLHVPSRHIYNTGNFPPALLHLRRRRTRTSNTHPGTQSARLKWRRFGSESERGAGCGRGCRIWAFLMVRKGVLKM
jgi:hypothetical protein